MRSSSTFPDRRELWALVVGAVLVTARVLMHAPMFLMGRHNHFVLAGMPIGWDMIVGGNVRRDVDLRGNAIARLERRHVLHDGRRSRWDAARDLRAL